MMNENQEKRVAAMTFASVYPHYVTKVVRKGRTKEELHQVITWLTGYDDAAIARLIDAKATFAEFFDQAEMNPNSALVTGLICGIRVEQIEHPLMRNVRVLDKLVDELAKGRKMEKVLRV